MKNSFYFLLLIFLIIGAGCLEKKTSQYDNVIASVSGERLTMGQAIEQIPSILLQHDTLHAVHNFANQWVESRVVADHAKRVGIQNTSDFQEKMNRYYVQLLEKSLREFILSEHESELGVNPLEAQNYYQTHREQFKFDEKYVRFRHLTTRTRAEADEANRELMAGTEWEEIVENYSVNPEYQLRQAAQFWPISMALADIPVLHQNVRILGISERSPIYYHQGQYHLIQLVEEKTEGEYPELDWLIPKIEEWLKLEKARRITNAYLRNLYLQADANNEIELLNVSEIERLLSE